MRVGLLGGSFNPPHEGHLHISEVALKSLGLDAVWWLVTPGNPLKSKAGLPSVSERMKYCRSLVHDRRIIVCDLESKFGTARTIDTVPRLIESFPYTDFVWLAGTEIAHEFHRWYKWRDLIRLLPFAFIGRPTVDRVVRNTVIHNSRDLNHHYPRFGSQPKLVKGHIYWILSESRIAQSSTNLRSQRG